MISWKFVLPVLLIVLAAGPALVVLDRHLGYGGPAPEDHYREMTSMGRYGGVRCGISDGVSLARLDGQQLRYIYPGAGGDTFITGPGSPFVTFDFDSERTGDDHDLLVLAGLAPDKLNLSRKGPHLLICGQADAMELIIVRQYCYGHSPAGPWNNQYEEIVFPAVRQIWLADDLYEQYRAGGDLAAVSRVDDVTELKKDFLATPEKWTVRAFGDALPVDWFAPYACRRDLD